MTLYGHGIVTGAASAMIQHLQRTMLCRAARAMPLKRSTGSFAKFDCRVSYGHESLRD